MNILYLMPTYPYVRGHHFFREVEWMVRRGHAISIAALESLPPELDGRETLVDYEIDGVPELLLDDDPDPVDKIIDFALQNRVDLIDAHDGRMQAVVAMEIERRTGIPFTVRFHGGDLHTHPSPRLAEIASAARALCPISRYLSELLTGERYSCRNPRYVPVIVAGDRVRVTPHGMPAELIADAPRGSGNGHPEPVEGSRRASVAIGTICRLDDVQKGGLFDVIEAFGKIAGEFPNATLSIVGGGEMQPVFEQHAREHGVMDRLTITGYVPWREALQAAAKLDVFVHGSDVEGFCLPVLEAAALGLPMAVTRTGVSEEIVDDGVNGYLYDYGDAHGLADRLRMLIAHGAESRQRMGRLSLARVRERFTFESVMARTEGILAAAAEGVPLPP